MTPWSKVTLDYRPRQAFSLLLNDRNSQVIWKAQWVDLCSSTIFSCERRAHFPLNIYSSLDISHGPWLWFSLRAKITTKQLALFTILSPNIGMMFPVEHVLCKGWVLTGSVGSSTMGLAPSPPQSSRIWDPSSFRDELYLSKWVEKALPLAEN